MVSAAFQAMLGLVADPRLNPRLAALKREFELRTGSFASDNPWFEVRSAAFLEDALCFRGLLRDVEAFLAPEVRAVARLFEEAHRGLFRVTRAGEAWKLVDVWTGDHFIVKCEDEGLSAALSNVSGYVDGRLVGQEVERVLLPGAIFHGADATDAITRLVLVAKQRGLVSEVFLDTLLRMDHALRSLSRVKAPFAYRVEALPR